MGGNPVSRTDPSGLSWQDAVVLFVEVGAEFAGSAAQGFLESVLPPPPLGPDFAPPRNLNQFAGRMAGRWAARYFATWEAGVGCGLFGLGIAGSAKSLGLSLGLSVTGAVMVAHAGSTYSNVARLTARDLGLLNTMTTNARGRGTNAPAPKGQTQGTASSQNNSSAAPKRLPRFDGPKPRYHVNEAHRPGTRFVRGKTPLPDDAEDVFLRAVPDDPISPRNWYGKNADGQIYRFSGANDGTAHFSGIEGVGDGVRNITRYARERLAEMAK